nr:F-box only protein 15 isoform X2 [Odocoileus virginianus texanus]
MAALAQLSGAPGLPRGAQGSVHERRTQPLIRTRPGATLPEGPAALSRCARQDKAYGRPRAGCSASLDSLPSEVLLKILSYLDVAALLCAGCVNRRFYHLASDNFIWIRIYSAAFSPKRSHWRVDPAEKTDLSVNLLSAGDKEAGYWKKEYLTKQIASVKAALARVLKPLHPHTGLPLKTKEALRMSGLGWVIILRGDDGREHTMEHAHLSFNDSSVTVAWYSKAWPPLATLSTLDLCGVTPVFMGQSRTPTRIRLSLPTSYLCMAPMAFSDHQVPTEPAERVQRGGWRQADAGLLPAPRPCGGALEEGEGAGVRYGKPASAPPGGEEHAGVACCSCSIMDLTLLEEYGKPFWCFSSPVCVRCCPGPSDGPHFLGEAYCVDYSDSEGRLHMELVWIEDTEEYFIVSLALYLRLAKINQWFGTKY